MAKAPTFTGTVSAPNMNGSTIQNVAAPAHSHTISTHHHTSATMHITQKFINFNQSTQVGPLEGDMRMNMEEGALECYTDGTWQLIAGKKQKTQVDLIRDQLKEFWPEVLFDLMMKDLI